MGRSGVSCDSACATKCMKCDLSASWGLERGGPVLQALVLPLGLRCTSTSSTSSSDAPYIYNGKCYYYSGYSKDHYGGATGCAAEYSGYQRFCKCV